MGLKKTTIETFTICNVLCIEKISYTTWQEALMSYLYRIPKSQNHMYVTQTEEGDRIRLFKKGLIAGNTFCE